MLWEEGKQTTGLTSWLIWERIKTKSSSLASFQIFRSNFYIWNYMYEIYSNCFYSGIERCHSDWELNFPFILPASLTGWHQGPDIRLIDGLTVEHFSIFTISNISDTEPLILNQQEIQSDQNLNSIRNLLKAAVTRKGSNLVSWQYFPPRHINSYFRLPQIAGIIGLIIFVENRKLEIQLFQILQKSR